MTGELDSKLVAKRLELTESVIRQLQARGSRLTFARR
jgi:hypothetical protein